MSRLKDVLHGSILGAALTGTIVAIAAEQTMDPVKLSPQYYGVPVDNDRVRVLDYHLKPGEKETMHSHPDGIVVALANSTVKASLPDGSSSTHTFSVGDAYWRSAITHSVENIGTTETHVVIIDMKGCTK